MRLRLSLLSATLLLTACGGGGDGAITVASTAAPAAFDQELCSEFDASDGPSDELIAGLPGDYAGAAQAIAEFGESMDAMGDNDDDSIDALVMALTEDGVADDLRSLADFAVDQCGESEGSTAISGLATAAAMASAERDDAYCDALETGFGTEDGGPEQLASLAEIAPESHRESLEFLSTLGDDDASLQQDAVFGPLMGLGVYAESACAIDGALAQMLLGAMFMGMGDDIGSTDLPDDASGSEGTSGEGADPAVYPAASPDPANAAVPAGAAVEFEVVEADLEDDGEYLASMVVPVGWTSESGFNVEFSPPPDSGASIFTVIEAGAGCDGTCEATDWDTRLRGDMGVIASFTSSHPSASEAPIAGSAGVVLTDTTDEVAALVLRWDDTVDKYFSCEVRLEDDEADLLPAFVAACQSSRPAWFPVG